MTHDRVKDYNLLRALSTTYKVREWDLNRYRGFSRSKNITYYHIFGLTLNNHSRITNCVTFYVFSILSKKCRLL